jgi:hypothetical protein
MFMDKVAAKRLQFTCICWFFKRAKALKQTFDNSAQIDVKTDFLAFVMT